MKNLERVALLRNEAQIRPLTEDENGFLNLWEERNRQAKAVAAAEKRIRELEGALEQLKVVSRTTDRSCRILKTDDIIAGLKDK